MLDLNPHGEHFALRRTSDDGEIAELVISADDVLTLCQSAQAFRARILLRHQPKQDGVEAILVTTIEDVALRPDSLEANVLLFLQAATGTQVTYALSPQVARRLLERLPPCLEKIQSANPTKQ
jgi:hypothetical protein